ncbi:hypothetical protein ASZ78_000718 [Callipepla squamata]|uniref:Uncharacterized protein n=1 Tax=Callipepla squamata TaxID=9009 RepID=A0A226N283_CALSU|nr:hypothetical protein ASZ78_000718 [Callipepla squamata]
MECCESLLDVSSKSQVNQAVDASSDFRVCFTTSRSTTARVPLLSRAVNTDITMINKFRHGSGETCARVARSVSGADPALEMGSQLADGHQDGSAAAAERHAQVKEQRERGGDAKVSTDRHRGNTFANTEVDSSVLSVLGELKNNYSSMRAKIQTGTPLDALPPLSVEIKSLPTAASYIPRKGDLRPHFQKHQALEETNKRASGAKQAPGTSASEVSPSASNSSSFARLMKKLAAIHPEATRDKIASALLEVKESNHGVLRGLSIASIIGEASAILSKPTPAREGSVKK